MSFALQLKGPLGLSPKILIKNANKNLAIICWKNFCNKNKKISVNPNSVICDFISYLKENGNEIEVYDSSKRINSEESVVSVLPKRIVEFVYNNASKVSWRKIEVFAENDEYIEGADLQDGDKFKRFKKACSW